MDCAQGLGGNQRAMGPQHSGRKQQHSPQREEGVQQPQGSPHPTHGPASSCRDWEFHRNSMQGGETEARQHPGTGRGDVLQGQVPKTKKEEKKGQKKKKKKHQRKHSAEAPQPHSPRCGFEVEKEEKKKKIMMINAFSGAFPTRLFAGTTQPSLLLFGKVTLHSSWVWGNVHKCSRNAEKP